MNIRLSQEKDMDRLVEIWLEGSCDAHHFIDPEYWKSMRAEMKHTYLPMSKTYVLDIEGELMGFVSMVDHYLAALFIDVVHQKQGYGKRLLDYVKQEYDTVQLKVFHKNKNALQFYLKNGFVITQELIDGPTTEKEYLMVWQR
jgi:putative acetyltransferase